MDEDTQIPGLVLHEAARGEWFSSGSKWGVVPYSAEVCCRPAC